MAREDHVLYVGRLGREKGVVELLHAAARSHEPWRLRLHGSGSIEHRLRRLAEDLGLGDRVQWRPYLSDRAELARAYAAARVVVMPGAHETFGLVGFEAAASGARVVTCATAPSAAHIGGLASTYEPGDVDGLLAAIERERAGEPDHRAAAALAARSTWPPRSTRRSRSSNGSCTRALGPAGALSTGAAGRASAPPARRATARRVRVGAERVLRANWREGTRRDGSVRVHVPGAAPLPPHVALGLVLSRDRLAPDRSRSRARRATDRAALGRPDGFLPHTAFWDAPAGWRRAPLYATRGVLGDRVHRDDRPAAAGVAWELVAEASPDDPGFRREALPALAAHLDWLEHHRDPDGDGLLAIVVPDESGLDDSPKYPAAFGRLTHDSAATRSSWPGARARWDSRDAHRAPRPPRRGRVGQRRLRAVAARDGATERRRVVEPASRPRRGGAARPLPRRARGCSSTSRAARSGPCAVSTWSALSPLVLPGLPEPVRRRLVEEHLLDERRSRAGRHPVGQHAGAVVSPELGSVRTWRGPSWVNTAWLLTPAMRALGYDAEADGVVDALARRRAARGLSRVLPPAHRAGARRARVRLVDAAHGPLGGGAGDDRAEDLPHPPAIEEVPLVGVHRRLGAGQRRGERDRLVDRDERVLQAVAELDARADARRIEAPRRLHST